MPAPWIDCEPEPETENARILRQYQSSLEYYHRPAGNVEIVTDEFPGQLFHLTQQVLQVEVERHIKECLTLIEKSAESPLEVLFANAFLSLAYTYGFSIQITCAGTTRALQHPNQSNMFQFAMQVPIDKYRADFVIASGSKQVVVEADGERWHSNHYRVRKDKQRDRALQQMGYAVFRYVGPELLADAGKAAYEIIQYLIQQEGIRWRNL